MELPDKEIGHKRVLICLNWYEPGFKAGGPIRSVANIVNALKDEFEFYILTCEIFYKNGFCLTTLIVDFI